MGQRVVPHGAPVSGQVNIAWRSIGALKNGVSSLYHASSEKLDEAAALWL
jgi:hypothetical protein